MYRKVLGHLLALCELCRIFETFMLSDTVVRKWKFLVLRVALLLVFLLLFFTFAETCKFYAPEHKIQ